MSQENTNLFVVYDPKAPKNTTYSTPKIPAGFLKYLIDDMCNSLKAIPKNVALFSAEVLLSSCCFNVRFHTEIGMLQPNIWNQIIMPSGSGKSVPIDNWIIPTLKEVEKHDPKHPLIMSSASPESIPTMMNWHRERDLSKEPTDEEEDNSDDKKKKKNKDSKKTIAVQRNLGIWILDESSAVMRGIDKKDYMIGLTEIASKIYDGHVPANQTIGRGFEEVPYTFKAFIACTTPIFYSLIKNDKLFQGGENRKDTIVMGGDFDITAPELNEQEHDLGEEREERINWYASKLLNLTKLEDVRIVFTVDASVFWKKYWVETKGKAKPMADTNLHKGYLNRQAEKAVKRAVIYMLSEAIMRDDFDQYLVQSARMFNGKKTLMVTKRQMEMAIHNQQFCYENFVEMLKRRDEWKRGNPDRARTNADERALLWQALTSDQSGFTSRQYIIDYTGFNCNDKRLIEGINSFIEEEKIKIHCENAVVRSIIQERGSEWTTKQKIDLRFRRPPYIFEVVDKSACSQ